VSLATIDWYSSELPFDDRRLSTLDPAANPEWFPEPNLAFDSDPGDTKRKEVRIYPHNPYSSLLAVVTVSADLAGFSLRVRGQ
jgi:hypothetical protein